MLKEKRLENRWVGTIKGCLTNSKSGKDHYWKWESGRNKLEPQTYLPAIKLCWTKMN